MKKTIAIIVCLIMVAACAISAISAYDPNVKIDARELQEYGQQHFYLGAPVEGANIPNVNDGVVNEGEYTHSYTYKRGDLNSGFTDKAAAATIIDNVDGVDVYMSYDAETFYVAQVTKDPNYIIGKDGYAFNICFKDGPLLTDSVSRLCFDIYATGDGSDINSFTSKCRHMVKAADGSWNNPPGTDGTEHIEGLSVSYDEETQLFTMEVAFDIPSQMEFWGNELPLEEVRMYFVPFVYMQGESVAGAGDSVFQGVLWSYLPTNVSNEIRMRYAIDHPDMTYWCDFVPNIVHFCEKPAETTPPPTSATTTTATKKVTMPTVPATTTAAPTEAPTNAPKADATTAAEKEKGCGSTVALSALAIVPMLGAAVVFGKKKED